MTTNDKTILSARGIGKTVRSGSSDLVILREIDLDVGAGDAVALQLEAAPGIGRQACPVFGAADATVAARASSARQAAVSRWVRPLPLPPRDLARRLGPTHAELVDSAVQAIVQQYLDSMAREPGAATEFRKLDELWVEPELLKRVRR